jgi:hypothetical protein
MALKKRGVPKQPKVATRIQIVVPDANADVQGKINVQQGLRVTVPKSSKYDPDSPVATSFDGWTATTDKAEALYQGIIKAESVLEQLYTSLGTVMGQYALDRDVFIAAVRGVCENEADAKEFGLDVSTHRRRVDAAVPDAPHFSFGDVGGSLTVRWPAVLGAGAYIAEQRVEAPTDESWEQCYMGRSPFFKLASLTLGKKLWFRVRAIGKTPSAWSDPSLVVVR